MSLVTELERLADALSDAADGTSSSSLVLGGGPNR